MEDHGAHTDNECPTPLPHLPPEQDTEVLCDLKTKHREEPRRVGAMSGEYETRSLRDKGVGAY